MLTCALRYPWLRVTDACESVALWIPPGGTELTSEEEESLGPVLDAFANERGTLFPEIMRRFEASHPQARVRASRWVQPSRRRTDRRHHVAPGPLTPASTVPS